MMVSQQDIFYQRERYKDLLREAEQARLLDQLRAESPQPSLWERLRERLTSSKITLPTTVEAPPLANCLKDNSELAMAH